MSRAQIERRLREVGDQLKRLRGELDVADEQLAQLAGEAEEARIRSLVSETPVAERDHRDAQRHADAMARHRDEVRRDIAELEARLDELLDRLADSAPS